MSLGTGMLSSRYIDIKQLENHQNRLKLLLRTLSIIIMLGIL